MKSVVQFTYITVSITGYNNKDTGPVFQNRQSGISTSSVQIWKSWAKGTNAAVKIIYLKKILNVFLLSLMKSFMVSLKSPSFSCKIQLSLTWSFRTQLVIISYQFYIMLPSVKDELPFTKLDATCARIYTFYTRFVLTDFTVWQGLHSCSLLALAKCLQFCPNPGYAVNPVEF